MEAEFVGVAALALTPTGLGPLSRTWPTSAKGKRPRIQPGSTLTRVTCGIAAGGVVLTGDGLKRRCRKSRIFRRMQMRWATEDSLESRWQRAAKGIFEEDDRAPKEGSFTDHLDRDWEDFRRHIEYLESDQDYNFVKKALMVASLAHDGQYRKSGDRFIAHPIEVAIFLAKLQVDKVVLAAGLLHDTVEDCDIDLRDLEEVFGADVPQLVDAVTKASTQTKPGIKKFVEDMRTLLPGRFLHFLGTARTQESAEEQKAKQQSENLRDMFLAMADDYRVILIKLADRLHNMRTLGAMKPDKQEKKAMETLCFFAPLAHRLGHHPLKMELEDLSFMYLNPEAFSKLREGLVPHRREFEHVAKVAHQHLNRTLQEKYSTSAGVTWDITASEKGMYSLWRKLQRDPAGLIEAVKDIFALRIVVDVKRRADETEEDYEARTIQECYEVFEAVRHMPRWHGPAKVEKDYIECPKPNGYQSLHGVWLHPGSNVSFEIQVRTKEMHQVAERGHMARYGAKEATPWLQGLHQGSKDPQEFVEDIQMEILGKRCYVFLKDGSILNLSRGCTVLDAAFKIHTEVGLCMAYPEVNGKRVALDYELQNSDKVNIVKADKVVAQEVWEDYAFLRKTRSELRSYFDRQRQAEGHIDLAAGIATAGTVGTATLVNVATHLPHAAHAVRPFF
mmetsp:Transcript_33696/g.76952  ORF Transcript_33696/g.76952 Transcript_33696/m.76952 type:complete len:674 (-) Transcript_33696:70-2091(-)